MKNLIILSLLLTYSISGCFLFLAVPKKLGKEKWKTEDYKLKLKHRQDFAGPSYYKVKLTKRGLFYSEHKFSLNYSRAKNCTYRTEQPDSITIDFCKRTINDQKSEKLKVR